MCAPAARGRGREAAEPPTQRRAAERRPSIADGTAEMHLGEEVAATFRDTEDFSPRALCLCRYAPPATYSPFFFFACLFADTTLVRVTKPRFGSKYSGVLRSPQELKIIGGPTVVRSTPYFCPSKKNVGTKRRPQDVRFTELLIGGKKKIVRLLEKKESIRRKCVFQHQNKSIRAICGEKLAHVKNF